MQMGRLRTVKPRSPLEMESHRALPLGALRRALDMGRTQRESSPDLLTQLRFAGSSESSHAAPVTVDTFDIHKHI